MLRRILTNMGWSSAEQITRMIVGLITSVWLTRCLGPHQYGSYNLIVSTAAIAAAFIPMASDQILQRELIGAPQRSGELLCSAFVLRILGAAVASCLVVTIILALRPDQPSAKAIAAFAGLAVLFNPAEVITVWFSSNLNARATFLAKLPSILASLCLRIVLALFGAPLLAFVALIWAEAAVTGLCLALAYRTERKEFSDWRSTKNAISVLWRDSWPLLIAGLLTVLYLKIDVVMLAAIRGDGEVGLYGAATRLSEVWFAIPMIVSLTLQPVLFSLKSANPDKYQYTLRSVYASMAWISIALAIATSFVATPLCVALFGSKYEPSGAVLAIHIWSAVPIFLGVTSTCFLIVENHVGVTIYRTVIGLAVNVGLNLLLMPLNGAVGAAIATVISYTCATFVIAMFPATRHHALAMLRALSPLGILDLLKPMSEIGLGLSKRRTAI